MLLVGQLGDLQIQGIELLLTMLLVGVLFLDGLLALLLLGLLVALMAQLLKALADLLVKLHEGRRRRAAQTLQRIGGQQAGEGAEFRLQAFAVAGQLPLLVQQQLPGLLAGVLGRLQLLLQAPGVLLQVEQGALALFVLADALGQLGQLLGQPRAALVDVLVEQRGAQRMGLQARCQPLLLHGQLLLLLQKLFLLSDQAAHFTAQFGEFFLEAVDGFLRRCLFTFIMATQAL